MNKKIIADFALCLNTLELSLKTISQLKSYKDKTKLFKKMAFMAKQLKRSAKKYPHEFVYIVDELKPSLPLLFSSTNSSYLN